MRKSSRVALTHEMKERLELLRSQTGWSGSALFNTYLAHHRLAKEGGLSAATINNWLYGGIKSVDPDAYNCVVEAFEQVPVEKWWKGKGRTINRNRTELTPSIMSKISLLSSSYPPLALRMVLAKSDLKGLTPALISSILSGQHKAILTSHLSYIEGLLEERASDK